MVSPENKNIEELRTRVDMLASGEKDARRERLASRTDALTLEEVVDEYGDEILETPQLQRTIKAIGWVVEEDREGVTWMHTYTKASPDGDEDFTVDFNHELYDLFERPRLDNFMAYLWARPIEYDESGAFMKKRAYEDESDSILDVYAQAEFFIRARAIDPELFNTLHEVARLSRRVETGALLRVFDKGDDETFDNPLAHLLKQAYMIMGRLVRSEETPYEDITTVLSS